MTRGRNRRFNPSIPGHIDQKALPQGIYWADNRWYIIEPHPEGGRPRKRTVAYAPARLSELHAIAELAQRGNVRGTLAYVCDEFERSTEFAELATGTQKGYRQAAAEAKGYVLADGSRLGERPVARINVPMVQRLVETIAAGRPARGVQPAMEPRPSKANHVVRYLRRTFNWGIRFGLCEHNPAKGVREVREAGEFKMPTPEAFAAMLDFVKVRGRLKAHTRGSVPPYLHAVMVLAYNLRLRGIEVTTLTDAHYEEEGIRSNRRKGSRDNITLWNEELKEAWAWLVDYRKRVMTANERPVPLRPEQRQLLVSQEGTPLTKSALDSAWQRAVALAITACVLNQDTRFTLHGLKHRGVTDTAGNLGDKQDASGHVDRRMTARYAHDLPVVSPPARPKATGSE